MPISARLFSLCALLLLIALIVPTATAQFADVYWDYEPNPLVAVPGEETTVTLIYRNGGPDDYDPIAPLGQIDFGTITVVEIESVPTPGILCEIPPVPEPPPTLVACRITSTPPPTIEAGTQIEIDVVFIGPEEDATLHASANPSSPLEPMDNNELDIPVARELVTLSVPPTPVPRGGIFTYTATYTNLDGQLPAVVEARGFVPNAFEIVSVSSSVGDDFNVVPNPATQRWEHVLGAMDEGESLPVTVTLKVALDAEETTYSVGAFYVGGSAIFEEVVVEGEVEAEETDLALDCEQTEGGGKRRRGAANEQVTIDCTLVAADAAADEVGVDLLATGAVITSVNDEPFDPPATTTEVDIGILDVGVEASFSFAFEPEGVYTITIDVTTVTPDSNPDNNTVTFEGAAPATTMANTPEAGDTGHPISTLTGELFETVRPDLVLGGPLPLIFQRYYGAFLHRDGRIESPLGPNWAHTFDWRLLRFSATSLEVVTSRGRAIAFTKTGDAWEQATLTGRPYHLVEDGDGFVFADPRAQRLYAFDAEGWLTEVADGRGNTLTLTYASGRLAGVADGLGRVLTFTYSGDRLSEVTDGTRTVAFGYDADGLLTSVTDPLGHTTAYTYETEHTLTGLMASQTWPEGNTVFAQTFDAEGRVLTQTDALGNALTLAYDGAETVVTDALGQAMRDGHSADGQLTSYTDKQGRTVALGYDVQGRRSEVTDRLGAVTQLSYDAASGLPVSVTEAHGAATRYTYTERTVREGITFHDLTGITHPDGTSIGIAYDASGNPAALTDQAGGTWSATYNERGQVLTATNPEGGETTVTYNPDGTPASVTDPAGNTTTYGYDDLRRLTAVTHADGTTRSYSYDAMDRLVAVTDEEGRTYAFAYDANGNLTEATDPAGRTKRYAYNAMDRLVEVTDRLGATATFGYDALGRLVSFTGRDGRTATFAYDADGRLTSLTGFGGETVQYAYDAEGVLTARTNAAGETTTYASNAMGWITQVTSPLGHTTEQRYDAMGRVTAVTDALGRTTTLPRESRGLLEGMMLPGGVSATYVRGGLGLLEAVTDPNGHTWDRPRDALGRLTAETDPLGRSASFMHDARNRVSEITLPGGLGTAMTSYDGTGRPTARAYSDGTSFTYSYDDTGRLVEASGVTLKRDAEGQVTQSNGMAVEHDAKGRPVRMTLPGGDVLYRYNNQDLLTEVEDWLGGVTAFSYDAAHRLTQITRPNGTTATYTYDDDGRLVGIEESTESVTLAAVTLERDAQGQITQAERTLPLAPALAASEQAFRHDAAGQVEAFAYDELGRRTGDAARTYTWDAASRLTGYHEDGQETRFTYDAFGHRLSRETDGTTHHYIWNYALGLPSVAVEQEGGSDVRYYVHTSGGQLLYSVDAADGSRRYYHYDEVGNTQVVTDDDGALAASYVYSPYGEVLAAEGEIDPLFTWQGAFGVMREGATGLYYVRARTYDGRTGRFLSRDPIRQVHPAEITPYQYARNNPLRFVDPTGLDPIEPEDFWEGLFQGFGHPAISGIFTWYEAKGDDDESGYCDRCSEFVLRRSNGVCEGCERRGSRNVPAFGIPGPLDHRPSILDEMEASLVLTGTSPSRGSSSSNRETPASTPGPDARGDIRDTFLFDPSFGRIPSSLKTGDQDDSGSENAQTVPSFSARETMLKLSVQAGQGDAMGLTAPVLTTLSGVETTVNVPDRGAIVLGGLPRRRPGALRQLHLNEGEPASPETSIVDEMEKSIVIL